MVSVCRFCARWAEGVMGVDDILLDNMLHAKDAVKQMFGFDLQNAEKVFLTLQERGELAYRVSESKNAGDTFRLEEMVEHEPVSVLSQNCVQETVELADGNVDGERLGEEMDSAAHDEGSLSAQPSERVIEISIEAIEELEITSSPLESAQVCVNVLSQSNRIQNSVDKYEDENHAPAIEGQRSTAGIKQECVNESHRRPMGEAVPPEQKANGADVCNKCYVCYRVYRTEAELMAHLIEHNDLLPYRCEQCSTIDCPFEFRTNQALNKHLETHSYPFRCGKCRLRFRSKCKIFDHIRTVHLHNRLYVCKHCKTKFYELRHMAAHRNEETERYPTTASRIERKQLVQRRSSRPFFQCAHCNRVFKYYANYKIHQTKHQQSQYLFRCSEIPCETYFTTYREWRRHMKLHYPYDGIPFMFEMLPESLQDTTV
uniref:C2H2-type domain-containing protein n=1 Tax=Anopheles maculatus TaxID=74869 RepID=A0A182T7Z2_9DIPT